MPTPPPFSTAYDPVHMRLNRARGKASAHICPCGRPARDWAYQYNAGDEEIVEEGRRYSANFEHYKAMCRSCHRFLDCIQEPVKHAKAGTGSGGAPGGNAFAARYRSDPEFASWADDNRRRGHAQPARQT